MMLKEKYDQEYIKLQNQLMVLELIEKHRPISRADISRLTSMSPTSVSRIVTGLCELGLVKETNNYTTGVGRRANLLDIDGSSRFAIGIDLDKPSVHVGILNFKGEVVACTTCENNSQYWDHEAVAREINVQIRNLMDKHSIELSKIVGIGVGLPGIIDMSNGTVSLSSQLTWKDVDFASVVERETGIPTVIDNDLKVQALAESSYGHIPSSKRTVLLSIGSGVGSALIIDGEIYRGEDNIAGEIGHSTVDPNGRLCECGKRGCLQTYMADFALIDEANRVKSISNVTEIMECYRNGESWAVNIIDRACTYAAITISNIVCVYNPDTVILGGHFIDQNVEVIEVIAHKLNEFIWEPFRETFKIRSSRLKGKAIIIGAGTLAFRLWMSQNYRMTRRG